MKIVFWTSLAGIIYTYAIYPLLIWMLAQFRPKTWMTTAESPSVSIVLAVRNGLALLPGKVQHLLNLDYPNIKEIIIVSDGSTDGTGEFLAELREPVFKTIVLRDHMGKAVAVNAGVAQATAEVILFLDIRPEVAPGALHHLVSNFGDSKVGCVAGDLILRQEGHDAAAGAVGGMYWRYEQWIRKCEAAFDSPIGVYGGFYAVRRELFVPLPVGLILDDMFQPLSIIRQGYRSVLDPNAVVFDTWPKKVSGEFNRKVRTLAGNFQLFQLAPWILTPQNRTLVQLVSHKVMRLIVPYLLMLLLVSTVALSVTSPLFATFATIQILSWTFALFGLYYQIPFIARLAAPASALLVLNAAAVTGLYKFLFTSGPLWKIWTSEKSVTAVSTRENYDVKQSDRVAGGGVLECRKVDSSYSRHAREH